MSLSRIFRAAIPLHEFSFLLGCFLAAFVCALFLVAGVSLLCAVPLTRLHFPLAVLVCIMFYSWAMRTVDRSRKNLMFAPLLVVTLGIVCSALFISGLLYDFWCDGQLYHKEAVIALANGWNPYYEAAYEPGPDVGRITYYAKGAWLAAAVIYKAVGRIEYSKACALILLAASFFLVLSALTRRGAMKIVWAALISFAAAANPVSLCQSLSFYVDGQVASMLVACVALLYLWVTMPLRPAALLIALLVAMLPNVKLTGLVYAVIGCLVALVLLRVSLVRRKKYALLLFGALAAGIFVFGYNPYVTNTLRYRNPFYPFTGPVEWAPMKAQFPSNFEGLNRFQRLAISLFSRSGHTRAPWSTTLKIPFTVAPEELPPFVGADIRIGGFGPLFSGALVVTFIVIGLGMGFHRKAMLRWLGLVAVLLGSAVLFPDAWWARFVPQLWFVPLGTSLVCFYSRRAGIRLCGIVVLLVLCGNVFLIAQSYFTRNIVFNAILKKQLMTIKSASQGRVPEVSFYMLRSSRIWFQELGIPYIEAPSPSCADPIFLIGAGNQSIKVCIKHKPVP